MIEMILANVVTTDTLIGGGSVLTVGGAVYAAMKWLGGRKNLRLNLLNLQTGDAVGTDGGTVDPSNIYDPKRCADIHAALNKRMDLSETNQQNLRDDIKTNHKETNENFTAVFNALSDIKDRLLSKQPPIQT